MGLKIFVLFKEIKDRLFYPIALYTVLLKTQEVPLKKNQLIVGYIFSYILDEITG